MLDPNEGRIPARVSSEVYERVLEREQEYLNLLGSCLDILENVPHAITCSALYDSSECDCGIDELIENIRDVLV